MYSKKQADIYLNADARWNIYAGAVRSGKTFITYDLILKRLCELPDGFRVMIGRTQQTLERNVLNPMRERYGASIVSHINSKNTAYIAGKAFYVVGADNKEAVTKIKGLGLVYGYGDEVTTWHEDVFQMLKSRLSDRGAVFDGTCNPASPSHWLKKEIIDNDALSVKTWHFTLDDNPFLDKQFVDALKLEYVGVWYRRYILGEWCLAEGLIYPNFSRELHTVKTEGIPKHGEHYISIDYGTLNPFSASLWRVCGGKAYRIAEYYHNGRETKRQLTDEEYYQAIVNLAGELQIRFIVVDPSAASFITTIRKHGKFAVRKAVNDVLDGIRTTAGYLQSGKLLFSENCENAIREFGLYRWDDKQASGKPQADDKPMKENDHAMDEIRYFCMTVLRREIPLV